jgi:hypothetical protein
MWYLDHYSLSPLDDRYRDLPYEFLEFAYVRYYSLPDPGKVRDYLVMKKDQEKREESTVKAVEENLEAYSDFDEETKNMILNQFRGKK